MFIILSTALAYIKSMMPGYIFYTVYYITIIIIWSNVAISYNYYSLFIMIQLQGISNGPDSVHCVFYEFDE